MADGRPDLHLVGEDAEGETLASIPTRKVAQKARQKRQDALAEAGTNVVEDADGNVHRTKATTLVIPEGKRCTAMKVNGDRCKAGKMRGIEVCIFHSHLALTDDTLARLSSGEEPRLSPRKALKAVVALRAEELAEGAVSGALEAEGSNRTKAILSLIDSVDPLVQTEEMVTFSPEGAERASYKQLFAAFGA
jgi:hypothetical protein